MNISENFLFQLLVVHTMIPCFITTEIIECAAAAVYPERNPKDILLVFLVNMLTNPAAVLINFLSPYRILYPVVWTIFLEGVIFLIEALIYKKCLKRKANPFLFSFVLNAASYFIGLVF